MQRSLMYGSMCIQFLLGRLLSTICYQLGGRRLLASILWWNLGQRCYHGPRCARIIQLTQTQLHPGGGVAIWRLEDRQ